MAKSYFSYGVSCVGCVTDSSMVFFTNNSEIIVNIEDLEKKFPFERTTYHNYENVVPWCEQQFGEFGEKWYRYGTDIAMGIVAGADFYDYYRFARSEDAVLFSLRWS
jgi:hypothetical protein